MTVKRACAILLALLAGTAAAYTDVYELKMSLRVPRVFDNTGSRGYRQYQSQTVVAQLRVEHGDGGEPSISISWAENRKHKVGGRCVTYAPTEAEGVMWHVLGSNRTGKFRMGSVKFELDLDPSYNVGDDEPDNALILTLAGRGNVSSDGRMKLATGYVAGQIGCGCSAYGHVSPTRVLGPFGATCQVVDIAAVHGHWRLKWLSRCR